MTSDHILSSSMYFCAVDITEDKKQNNVCIRDIKKYKCINIKYIKLYCDINNIKLVKLIKLQVRYMTCSLSYDEFLTLQMTL